MNAMDDIRIRTGETVTEREALQVLYDCQKYAEVRGLAQASPAEWLRFCDHEIPGGIRALLDEVRRVTA